MNRKKNSLQRETEQTEKYSGIHKFMNKGQMNIMQKFLEHTNLKTKHKKDSTLPSKIKLKEHGQNLIYSKNLPFNNSNELMKKMKQLESQLKSLDDEYDTLKEDNGELVEQNNYMKEINKKLFMKMRDTDDNIEDSSTGKAYSIIFREIRGGKGTISRE